MAAYRRFCDSRHLQADCQETKAYAGQSSMCYLFLFTLEWHRMRSSVLFIYAFICRWAVGWGCVIVTLQPKVTLLTMMSINYYCGTFRQQLKRYLFSLSYPNVIQLVVLAVSAPLRPLWQFTDWLIDWSHAHSALMRPVATGVVLSACVCIDYNVSGAETDEPIEVPFRY